MGTTVSKAINNEKNKNEKLQKLAQSQCDTIRNLIEKAIALELSEIKGSIASPESFNPFWKETFENLEHNLAKENIIFHIVQFHTPNKSWVMLDATHCPNSWAPAIEIKLKKSSSLPTYEKN